MEEIRITNRSTINVDLYLEQGLKLLGIALLIGSWELFKLAPNSINNLMLILLAMIGAVLLYVLFPSIKPERDLK